MKLFIVNFLFCAQMVLTMRIMPTGFTMSMNDIPYYVSPHSIGNVSLQSHLLQDIRTFFGFIPVSVMTESTQPHDLAQIVTTWKETDDVFQSGFLQLVLFDHADLNTTTVSEYLVENYGHATLAGYKSSYKVPQGPYFMDKESGALHQVYRLYDDFAGAFNEALLANPDGTFQTLSAKIPSSATLTIGVPSRLYYEKSDAQPLAGVRIAVKDIFSLAGVKRSNGNRAWYHLYPPSNVTSSAISKLMEAGAVIVGTQRVSQFATSEVATVDWVDYHSPFNPRGDGYQDPSSSSSGAGASVASYEWLDAAVGTDTGGSIRSPAGVNAVFGNRASHGIVASDHIMPLSEPLDTVGFLARDPVLWETLQSVLYSGNYSSLSGREPKYPSKVMTVSFPNSSTEAGRLLNEFAFKLAGYVHGNLTPLDLAKHWSHNVSLSEMFNITYPVLTGKGQDEKVKNPFYSDYATQHDGRRPFVDPAPLARWAWAEPYSWDEAVRNKTIFMDWFNSEILPSVNNSAQCSSGLILYPGKIGTQNPRNQYDIDPPTPYVGFSAARMSVFSECPDFIFPVGEVASFSALTNHTEYFPVAVGVLAAKGCDGLLAKLAIDLVQAGILQVPQIGNSIHGGEILL